MTKRDTDHLRSSTTSGLDYGKTEVIDLDVSLGRFRAAAPATAEAAMDSALRKAGLSDPAKARPALEHHEALYRERQNPFDALEAFVIARCAGLEVPEWVLSYFERATKRALLQARGPRGDRARTIAEAFDLAPRRAGRGRKPDAIEKLDREHRAAAMVTEVAALRKQGRSREDAIRIVADNFSSSDPVVRRALKLHHR
jgi:hypothetical protein